MIKVDFIGHYVKYILTFGYNKFQVISFTPDDQASEVYIKRFNTHKQSLKSFRMS